MKPMNIVRQAIRIGGGPVMFLAALCALVALILLPTNPLSGAVFLLAALGALAAFMITAAAVFPGSLPVAPVAMDRRRHPR